MKVAIVVHQFLPRYTTGTERYAYTLARGLQQRGLSVALFSGEDDGESLLAEDDYSVDGLPVHRLTCHRSLESDPIHSEYASAVTAAAFDRFLETERPDVIHFFHLYNLGGGLMDAARARGVPYVVHLMDYWFLCPRIQMLDYEGELCAGPREAARCARCAGEVDGNYRPLLEAANAAGLEALGARWPWLRTRLERAAKVIAPSRYLRDRFVENGLDPDHVHHLAYGVAASPPLPPAAAARAEGEVRFGYLGNLATFKGAHLALEAFTRLEGAQLSLHVFGDFFFREPEQMEACRKRVQQDPRITMRGRYEHEDLASILAQLDVVVVPSLWHENTPFVVLEALRSGTPVIASRVGGIAEAVREGEDGFLFARGDVEDLLRQMTRFAAGEGPATVAADHIPSPEQNVDAVLALYHAAVAAAESPSEGEAERVRATQRDGLYRALEALGERFVEAGGESGRERDVVEMLREAGRLRGDLAGHRAALEARAEEYDRLREDAASIEADYRRQLEERDRCNEDLEADLEGHRAALAQVTADLEAELAMHAREREARAAAEAALREDIERHRAVVVDLSREREAFTKVVADLEQDLDGHRKALELARAHGDELATALEASEAAVGRLTEGLRSARDAIGEQAAMIRRLEARLEEFAAEIDTTAQGRNL